MNLTRRMKVSCIAWAESDDRPVTGAGDADLSPGRENVGSESLNLWRLRPLLESSETEREGSLGRRRLSPPPALAISFTHRDVDLETGLDEAVEEDLA